MNAPAITQIDQCSLRCHAARVRVEIKKSMQDPEFMKRFEEWKAACDEEATELNEGEATK